MEELRTCEPRRDRLRGEIVALKETQHVELDIDIEQILVALDHLKETLIHATPQEVKALLQEHIKEIRVPPKGNALLTPRPEGLLNQCTIKLVTPRGTAMEATTLMFCGMPLLVVVQQPTVLLRFYDSTYHRRRRH